MWAMAESVNEINWEASEYIHHEKSVGWYLLFGLGSAIIIGGTYLLLEDIISIIVVTLMSITILVFANRRPRALQYVLSDEGIKIDGRGYAYSSFKSFSIMQYGAVESIYLEPLERFMPPISVYYAPEQAEMITEMIGQYLPHRDREPDFVDRLVHRIRL